MKPPSASLPRRRRLLASALAAALAWTQRRAGAVGVGAPLRIYGMDSRPVSYLEQGRPAGMAVELARAIQARIGSHDSMEIVPWARANTLAKSEANIMLLSIVPTTERRRYLRFVGPIFMSHIAIYALRERAAALRQRDPGLHRLRAGGRRDSVFVSLARSEGYQLSDEANSSESAARMLLKGRFDLWFEGEELAPDAIARAGAGMAQLEVMGRLPPQEVHFAFSPGTPDATIAAWVAALRAMKADGSYQRLHRRWLPQFALPPDARQPR